MHPNAGGAAYHHSAGLSHQRDGPAMSDRDLMMAWADELVQDLHSGIREYSSSMKASPATRINALERLSAVMSALRLTISFDQSRTATAPNKKPASATTESNKEKQPLESSVFSLHFPSLVMALITVFQRIVPSIYSELQNSSAVTPSRIPAAGLESGGFVPSAALAVLCGSLLLLGAVASTNTGELYYQSSSL
jgi:hypothetical protein